MKALIGTNSTKPSLSTKGYIILPVGGYCQARQCPKHGVYSGDTALGVHNHLQVPECLLTRLIVLPRVAMCCPFHFYSDSTLLMVASPPMKGNENDNRFWLW
jgi:hypothetical protein